MQILSGNTCQVSAGSDQRTPLPVSCSPAQDKSRSLGKNRINIQCSSTHPPLLWTGTFWPRSFPWISVTAAKGRLYQGRKLHRISYYCPKNSLILCGDIALLPTHINQFRPALHHSQPLFFTTLNKARPAGNTDFPCYLHSLPAAPCWPPATRRFAHLLTSSFLSLQQTVYLWQGHSLIIMPRAAQVKGSCLKPSWNLSTDCEPDLNMFI